jgi:hypothetical protein
LRDLLTALAALAAIALLALMVGPHFVDWDQQRGRVVELLRDRAGVEARIGGALRVSLLPTPEIDAEGVEFGPADNPVARAGRLTLKLSPAALLAGRFSLTEAWADRVDLSLAALRERLEARPDDGTASRLAGIGIDRLDLRSARLFASLGADRPATAMAAFDANLDAPSLLGPFRLQVTDSAGARDFKAQIGKLEDGRARMKGVYEDRHLSSRAALDGWFALPGVEGRPLFDGAATFNGNPVLPGPKGAQMPFQGSARVTLYSHQMIADPANISIGGGETALQLAGRAFVDLSPARPAFDIKLGGKRLDSAQFSPFLVSLSTAAGNVLPVDLALDLTFEAVQVPGTTIRNLDLKANWREGRLAVEHASALLPGTTRASFRRAADAGAIPLDGELLIEAGEVQLLAAWLRGAEGLARLPTEARLSARLKGDVTRFALERIALTSTAGDLAGSGEFAGIEAGVRSQPALRLMLSAERFDARVLAALDPLRPIPGLSLATGLRVAYLVLDNRELGGLDVELERDGDHATLRQLRLAGRKGEHLTLSGSATGDSVHFTAKLDAERLGDIAELSAAILPGPATEALLKRAPHLEPAIAVANFRVVTRDGEATWDVALDGKLGGTSVTGRTTSALRGNTLDVVIDGVMKNADGGRLATQLTGIVAPASTQPGEIAVRASGNPRKAIEGKVTGSIAGVALAFEGGLNPFRSSPLDGRFTLDSTDLSLLGQAFGGGTPRFALGQAGNVIGRFFADFGKITLTGLNARLGDEVVTGEVSFDLARNGQVAGQLRAGTIELAGLLAPVIGRAPLTTERGWSSVPFGAPEPPFLSGDLWIEAKHLRLNDGSLLEAPQFILAFAPDAIVISGFEAKRGDARIAGQLSLLRKDKVAELAGRFDFARLLLPGFGARLTGDVPLAASGETPLALVSSLSGAGKIALEDLIVPEADPAALGRVVAVPLEDLEPIHENRIGEIVDRELRKTSLRLPGATRSLGLLNGQVRIGGVQEGGASGGVAAVTPTFLADLVRREMEMRLTFRQEVLPKGWRGAVPEVALALTSRFANDSVPQRRLEVASLVNGFLAMAIQRDLERAEAFAADVREREAHLRRQQGDAFQARREREIREVEEAIALEAAALQRRAIMEAERERQRLFAIEQERLARERATAERAAAEKAAAEAREKAVVEARERAEREAADLAARTRARLEEERRRLQTAPATGTVPPPGAPVSGAPLDLTPRAAPPAPRG